MKTILVADDEFDLLSSLEIILQDEGYRVLTCGNGRAALDMLHRTKPDLLITDIMMPHLSGLDLLEQVRKEESLKDLRAIVMSAIRLEEHQKVAGNPVFLRKPFTIEQLMEAVNRSLK